MERLLTKIIPLSILGINMLFVSYIIHAGEGISTVINLKAHEQWSNYQDDADVNPPVYESPEVTDPNLKVEKVVGSLNEPTSMTFLGPNDILALERKKGTVQRIINGNILDKPLLDLPVNYPNRGILGIAIAKDENDTRTFVFLYFTESLTGKDTNNLTEKASDRLYRYELKGNDLVDPKLLLSISAYSSLGDGGHDGGKLDIGPDQNVYLVIGDLREHTTEAQNNLTGSPADGSSVIYRITQDGDPAPGNPLGSKKPVNLFYAYGIRNSFGFDFDPVTGNLWDTENGPDFGDEINLVEPGFNSGWKRQQGFTVNSNYPDRFANIGEKGKPGKYSDPEFVWNQPVGPTALKFLTSDKLGSQYKNDMFVGDANNGNIYHFDLKEDRKGLELYTPLRDKIANNMTELEEIIFGRGFGVLTDLDVGADGYLYVLNNGGEIWRIVPIAENNHNGQNSLNHIKLNVSDSTSNEVNNLDINLIDDQHNWLPFSAAFVTQNTSDLKIIVSINNNDSLFNRAYLPIKINSTVNNSPVLELDYATGTYEGNATFFSEIRDGNTNKILWDTILNNTNNSFSNQTFRLPSNILDKPVEFRFYIWTNSPGEHQLDVKKAVLRFSNNTQLT